MLRPPPSAELATLPPGGYQQVVAASASGALADSGMVAMLAAQLAPGGSVELREVAWVGSGELPSMLQAPLVQALRERPAEALRKAALYAGLQPDKDVKLQPLDAALAQHAAACLYPSLAAAATAESRDALVALGALLAPHLGLAVLTAAKPSYQAGQSFSLRSRKPAAPKPAAAPAPAPAPAAWGAAAGDDAELMDEDDLLDEEDLKKKVAERSSCVDDVKAGRRKPCANCSCGAREIYEKGEGDDSAPPPPKSACGSCGLGDAYRCADCPYLGQPAFKPGEEVKLSDSMFGGGVANATETKVATGGGGVVKLDLDDTMDF